MAEYPQPENGSVSKRAQSAFCEARSELIRNFLEAIRELTSLQGQQIQAVIEGDSDFLRFDVLIHMAAERKQEAKYALIRHIESHHCEEE
jgi:hypothetical protein